MASENGTLETNGARIYYEAEGSGEPVVMIHAGVANLRMWDDQVAALRDAYRVIRYDTRGFGRTETDAVEFSNRADIAALLDHLGERSAHIVGFSRAGSIALDFAIEYPDRVRSLVVGAGGISGYESPDEASAETFEAAEKLWEAKDWAALVRVGDRVLGRWTRAAGRPRPRGTRQGPRLGPDELPGREGGGQAAGARSARGGPPRRAEGAAAGRHRHPGRLRDAGVDAPPREAVPHARLEVFEGVAHMLNLEQPERFNALLLEFFGEAARTP